MDPELKRGNYPTDALPVFLGHYWLNDHMPALQSSNAVCLDYSIAKGGALVVYRWNGEEHLSNENFEIVVSFCELEFLREVVCSLSV